MTNDRLARTTSLVEGRRALGAIALASVLLLSLGALTRYAFLQGLDLHATRELQENGWPPLRALMLLITWIGSPVVVLVVGTLAATALWRRGSPRAARLVLLSLLSLPLDLLLKLLWDRARPDAAIVHVAVRTSGSSFPSGHAMGSTALCGALALVAWLYREEGRSRVALVTALVALPIAVDASRVYLGAHWLSDVVGGSAAGLLVLIPLARWYLGRATVEPAAP